MRIAEGWIENNIESIDRIAAYAAFAYHLDILHCDTATGPERVHVHITYRKKFNLLFKIYEQRTYSSNRVSRTCILKNVDDSLVDNF